MCHNKGQTVTNLAQQEHADQLVKGLSVPLRVTTIAHSYT